MELPPDVTVIALHGLGSSAEKSATVAACREYFVARGYEFMAPSYDTAASREENAAFFGRLIRSLDRSKSYGVIGCSLGGYWARYIANRLWDARLVMINPSLRFYGDDELADHPELPIALWVALDDEVVPPAYALCLYAKRASIKTFDVAGHRFSPLKDCLPGMESAINSIAG